MSEWRRVTSTLESDAELRDIAEQEISRFEAEFSDDLLQQMIRNHGSMPEQS
jgi:hypothetical protein